MHSDFKNDENISRISSQLAMLPSLAEIIQD
jgi:hypothetical protein